MKPSIFQDLPESPRATEVIHKTPTAPNVNDPDDAPKGVQSAAKEIPKASKQPPKSPKVSSTSTQPPATTHEPQF